MSGPMKKSFKIRPSNVELAPAFPSSRLLPTEPNQLSRNISLQKRYEVAFANQQRKKSQDAGEAYSGPPCCKTLHVTLAFDGTNNNDEADKSSSPTSRSNVARLYLASIGGASDSKVAGVDTANGSQGGLPPKKPNDLRLEGYYRYYSPGVGTVFPDIREYLPNSFGLIGASGGENRINWGLRMV